MKLAEALQERADLNRKIDQLRQRIENNVLVQEGEKSQEDPQALMKELDAAISRLEKLMADINLTNCTTKAGDKTLTEIIARKDALNIKLSAYRDIAYEASQNTRRARNTEIKIKSQVKVSAIQKAADEIAAEIRKLDNTLQETNWTTELIEK
ncbi:MAG: DIP1984 family protein [Firmicutes bacterium]|nr:DIP1984 family protein [Bacillota bacterium]